MFKLKVGDRYASKTLTSFREFVLRTRVHKAWGKPFAVHWLGTGGGVVQIWAKDWAPPLEFRGPTVSDALSAALVAAESNE